MEAFTHLWRNGGARVRVWVDVRVDVRDFLDEVWSAAPCGPSSELPGPLCKKYIKLCELYRTSIRHEKLYVLTWNALMIMRVCRHITCIPPYYGQLLSQCYIIVFALKFYIW